MPEADAAPFPLEGGYGVVAWLRAEARERGLAAVPALRVVAKEASVALRAAALLALAEIAPADTEAFVVDCAQHDPEREVREAATRALGFAAGELSFAHLRATEEERAATIALRQRFQRWATADLEALVAATLDATASEDRCASLALEILGAREVTPELVIDVLRRKPGYLAHGGVEGLGAVLRGAQQEELLSAIARGRAPAAMARHADPARFFEQLAPAVASGASTLAESIVEVLAEQASAAWSSTDGRGFDDGDPPVGPMPDERWRAVLAKYASPQDYDREQELESLRGALEWTYVPRALRTPSFRFIEAGAEEGAAFVLAGFDVSALRDGPALEVALATLGDRTETNLHHVSHQCGGYGCLHFTLLGIPLGSPTLTAELAPDSNAVNALLDAVLRLDDTRAILLPFVPHLPPLVGGEEALVWTEPGSLAKGLVGLSVVSMCPMFHPWRSASGSWIGTPDALRERGAFDATHQQLLEEVGHRLGLGRPRIFVLWANSD